MERYKIGIIGISADSGVSFLTTALAAYFAEQKKITPVVLELGKGSLYHSLGMERHFSGRSFKSVFEAERDQENVKNIWNLYKGINWALQTPLDLQKNYGFLEKFRLIHNIAGDLLFCDFSGCQVGRMEQDKIENEVLQCDSTWQLLREMNKILLVVDPLPSKLLVGGEQLARYRLSRLPITFVVNKDNKGVQHKELNNYLQIKDAVWIPYLEPQLLYEAEYSCIEPYGIEKIKKALWEPLCKIEKILGAENLVNPLFRQKKIHRNISHFGRNVF